MRRGDIVRLKAAEFEDWFTARELYITILSDTRLRRRIRRPPTYREVVYLLSVSKLERKTLNRRYHYRVPK